MGFVYMEKCELCEKETINEKFCSLRCRSKQRSLDATVKKTCPMCNKTFFVLRSSEPRIFCSKTCSSKAAIKQVTKVCLVCKTPFSGEPAKMAKRRCCSNSCRYLSQVGRQWNDKQKLRYSLKRRGANNPAWKGDNVTIKALHDWVKWWLPKTKKCQDCKKVPPYDLANISQKYKRDLADWEWLCRKCHMTKDGRIEKLKEMALKAAINSRKLYNKHKWGKYK